MSSKVINFDIKNKYAIVIGHTKDNPGTSIEFGGDGGLHEHFYNSVISSMLYDIADVYVHDTYSRGYGSMCDRTARRIKNSGKDYDLVLYLHFNSSHNRLANGSMGLYYFTNQLSKNLCFYFSKFMEIELGITKRHPKALVNKHDRGFGEIASTNFNAIIVEPFFGSSAEDCRLMFGNEYIYANKVLRPLLLQSTILRGISDDDDVVYTFDYFNATALDFKGNWYWIPNNLVEDFQDDCLLLSGLEYSEDVDSFDKFNYLYDKYKTLGDINRVPKYYLGL